MATKRLLGALKYLVLKFDTFSIRTFEDPWLSTKLATKQLCTFHFLDGMMYESH